MLALTLTTAALAGVQPWMNKADPPATRAKALLKEMTLVRLALALALALARSPAPSLRPSLAPSLSACVSCGSLTRPPGAVGAGGEAHHAPRRHGRGGRPALRGQRAGQHAAEHPAAHPQRRPAGKSPFSACLSQSQLRQGVLAGRRGSATTHRQAPRPPGRAA